MTEFRFNGEWGMWSGLLVALILAALAWVIYRRELHSRGRFLRTFLPLLRSLAVFLVVMMLAGPTLNHRWTMGEVARLLVFIDGSQSMSMVDDQMDLRRKVQAAQQLGWLPDDFFDNNLRLARAELGFARGEIERLKPDGSSIEFQKGVKLFSGRIDKTLTALKEIDASAWAEVRSQSVRFAGELNDPAKALIEQAVGNEPRRVHRELMTLLNVVARWQQTLDTAWQEHVKTAAGSDDTRVGEALVKFDAADRWKRMEGYWFGNHSALARKLARQHDVRVMGLEGNRTRDFWSGTPEQNEEQLNLLTMMPGRPTNYITDLNMPVAEKVTGAEGAQKLAVILFTDGQHNRGVSPLETARMFGQRGIPVFTVGVGMENRPTDLAVLEINTPETVPPEGGVRGEISIKDDYPAGTRFFLKVEHEGRLLWQTNLTTRNEGIRKIPFDFSVKETAVAVTAGNPQLQYATLPLKLKAEVNRLPEEKDTTNNQAFFHLAMVNRKPKILLMDGRPRWEFRYLRNLFERDRRWLVNPLLAGGGGIERPWRRGKQLGQFPIDREEFFSYDLIVFGEVPVKQLLNAEIEWFREYVESRGGGLIFIDGRKDGLFNYSASSMNPLFPVSWTAVTSFVDDLPLHYSLAGAGDLISPLNLSADPGQNAKTWASLPGPHWTMKAKALPGAEVLLEIHSQTNRVPAVVFRRYGAGKVLYFGNDETWRWRYNVGDLYHQKFWNQIANWMMEPPFLVKDKIVGFDPGKLQYRPGESAEFRVRLQPEAKVRTSNPKIEVVLLKDGKRIAVVELRKDSGETGIYRGSSPALESGDYDTRVQVAGIPDAEIKVKSSFSVGSQLRVEMAQLHCNEPLLRSLADESGGRYFREEEIDLLVKHLEPLSQGTVMEENTALWNSYWWFVPIILLLGIEWATRKKVGLV